jgi:hypothetical protein
MRQGGLVRSVFGREGSFCFSFCILYSNYCWKGRK